MKKNDKFLKIKKFLFFSLKLVKTGDPNHVRNIPFSHFIK